MHNQSPLVITKMFAIPTEHTYHQMYQRSFSIGMSPGDENRLTSYFQSEGVGDNNQLTMINAANQIGNVVGLSAAPTGRADIANGWDTQRLMFVLVVQEYVNEMTSTTHYVQGYSEHYDPSHTGRLDPNAMYYINSITDVMHTINPVNNAVSSRVVSTYNLISDASGNLGYNQVTEPDAGMELVRPCDIMSTLRTTAMYGENPGLNMSLKTTSLGSGANVSRKSNNDPLKYFTDSVNAVIVAKTIATAHASPADVLSNANGQVSEQPMGTNRFIHELARITGNLEPSSFTLNNLTRIDPAVNEKITVVASGGLMADPSAYGTGLDTEYTEGMLNVTETSTVAQTFVNSLTANMSDNLILTISGTVTNITGQSLTTISNVSSFLEGVDITPYGNRVVNYVNAVIMPQLTMVGMRIVSIVFSCDLLGDTTVSVSIDNSPEVIYRLPTFADSLYTPVITDKMTKSAVVEDFETVTDTVMSMGYTGALSY